MLTRRHLVRVAAAALATSLHTRGRAQTWPSRYIKLVVPFPPGGGTDSIGRILANRLSEMWGQQVIIENRGGAGSNIGTELVARAQPDGYTILFSAIGHAVNRFIYPTIPYDPVADFAPITLICVFPNVLAVPNRSPARSLSELIALAKARGGLSYGTSGIGSSPHLCTELFKRVAGIELTHVPYRGAGPALTDLVSGQIDMMFNTSGAMLPYVRNGQIRGLAVTSPQRLAAVPELPAVAELIPGFEVAGWYALFAPAATPPEVVARMTTDAVAALREPAVRSKLEELGLIVIGSTGPQLADYLRAEMDKWGPLIKAAKISIN